MELFTLSMTEQTDDSAFCSPLGSAWSRLRMNCASLTAFEGNAWIKQPPSQRVQMWLILHNSLMLLLIQSCAFQI